jgi:hypothetical protein
VLATAIGLCRALLASLAFGAAWDRFGSTRRWSASRSALGARPAAHRAHLAAGGRRARRAAATPPGSPA